MRYFDTEGDGTVSFDEFLIAIRVRSFPLTCDRVA